MWCDPQKVPRSKISKHQICETPQSTMISNRRRWDVRLSCYTLHDSLSSGLCEFVQDNSVGHKFSSTENETVVTSYSLSCREIRIALPICPNYTDPSLVQLDYILRMSETLSHSLADKTTQTSHNWLYYVWGNFKDLGCRLNISLSQLGNHFSYFAFMYSAELLKAKSGNENLTVPQS